MPTANRARPLISLNAAISNSPREPFVFPAIEGESSRTMNKSTASLGRRAPRLLFDSANRLFGAYIDWHQQFHRDALLIAGQLVDARHGAQEFLVNGTWITRIRKRHKDAHVGLENAILRDKIDTVPRSLYRWQDLIEFFGSWLRGPYAYHPRDSRAGLVPAFL